MPMRKTVAAADPAQYLGVLRGWKRECVASLRSAVLGSAALTETIKWGHLVYFSGGPVLLIRAEPERVLFGFWRGQRLRTLEPRLKAGGKYEMATMTLIDGDSLSAARVRRLVRAAVELNATLGDPTAAAR